MVAKLSRREFLQLGAVGAAGLATRTLLRSNKKMFPAGELGRITTTSVSVYNEPSDKSQILYQRLRDEVINLYYEVTSDQPPKYNPRWYRVWDGYIHSAHVQRVKNLLNPLVPDPLETGQLFQVTVPYTQSYWDRGAYGWDKNYRLYYESMHWVIGVKQGPDGDPWYEILDEQDNTFKYCARAEHLRAMQPEEFTPLSPDVPPSKKRIEVNLATQQLTAFEYDQPVFQATISSGSPSYSMPGEIPTTTPEGEFVVYSKMPSKHMGHGDPSSDPEEYVLPGVPWTSFFDENGVAFHGTYWHDNFGVPMSHGCVNMRTAEAQWIFRWTTPVNYGDKQEVVGNGTRVLVY
jgi:lipoprotein-anchoring transpeptidase ErfK/SrfK